jgi:hypothetical protein
VSATDREKLEKRFPQAPSNRRITTPPPQTDKDVKLRWGAPDSPYPTLLQSTSLHCCSPCKCTNKCTTNVLVPQDLPHQNYFPLFLQVSPNNVIVFIVCPMQFLDKVNLFLICCMSFLAEFQTVQRGRAGSRICTLKGICSTLLQSLISD